jgi:hypothetical protein
MLCRHCCPRPRLSPRLRRFTACRHVVRRAAATSAGAEACWIPHMAVLQVAFSVFPHTYSTHAQPVQRSHLCSITAVAAAAPAAHPVLTSAQCPSRCPSGTYCRMCDRTVGGRALASWWRAEAMMKGPLIERFSKTKACMHIFNNPVQQLQFASCLRKAAAAGCT